LDTCQIFNKHSNKSIIVDIRFFVIGLIFSGKQNTYTLY